MRCDTKFLDLFIARIGARLLLAGTVVALCTTLLPTVQVLALPTCAPGTHQVAGRCTPDPAPVALATDTATDDATAEGTTVKVIRLPEGYALETTPMVPVGGTRYVVPEESPDGGHVLPSVLWLDNSPVYSGPQSWVLHVDDTQHRVTWRLYSDIVSDVNDPVGDESSPVQTVAQVTTTAPPVQLSRQCVRAARDILHASLSRHLRVEEDLSYVGMPKRVGECNDQLATAYFADGHQMVNGRHDHRALRSFLRTVIRTGELPAVSSSSRA